MAKVRKNSKRQYLMETRELYQKDPMDIERNLITKISDTGKEQVKKRRKAGLSSYYVKDGNLVEVLPNNSQHIRLTVRSKWLTLEKGRRTIRLK
jgi:hypothetical protein